MAGETKSEDGAVAASANAEQAPVAPAPAESTGDVEVQDAVKPSPGGGGTCHKKKGPTQKREAGC